MSWIYSFLYNHSVPHKRYWILWVETSAPFTLKNSHADDDKRVCALQLLQTTFLFVAVQLETTLIFMWQQQDSIGLDAFLFNFCIISYNVELVLVMNMHGLFAAWCNAPNNIWKLQLNLSIRSPLLSSHLY